MGARDFSQSNREIESVVAGSRADDLTVKDWYAQQDAVGAVQAMLDTDSGLADNVNTLTGNPRIDSLPFTRAEAEGRAELGRGRRGRREKEGEATPLGTYEYIYKYIYIDICVYINIYM